MRYDDPDNDYQYDRTNQPAPQPLPRWTIQVEYFGCLTQWVIYRDRVRIEGGFADRASAQRELVHLRSTR